MNNIISVSAGNNLMAMQVIKTIFDKFKPTLVHMHKNAVIVRTPCNHDGWVCAGDYEFINDYD